MDKYADLKWYEIGDDGNPFNKRILDIRDFTQTMLAFSEDDSINKQFYRLRQNDGSAYPEIDTSEFMTINCNLCYEHDGKSLNGPIFKADTMEAKWDIYCYNNIFYFCFQYCNIVVFECPSVIA